MKKPPFYIPTMDEIRSIPWNGFTAEKMKAGVDPKEIIEKELSLSGLQRPLEIRELGQDAVEIFRFGEFAGWIIEGAL